MLRSFEPISERNSGPAFAAASGQAPIDVAEAVRAILSRPDEELDYARAKLDLDRLVDPSINTAATLTGLDTMVEIARRMAGAGADNEAKLSALRRLIYKSGPWNDYRPFDYDHSNVRGGNVRVKLLSHYLETRRGDCVSMPCLFLMLAEKLGVEMALVSAPNHMFLRYRNGSGCLVNLEATSGANPARDDWIRQVRPMSDRALESGLYMRTLTRREGVALMAGPVLQYLRDSHRYEEMIAVSEIMLSHNPRDGLTLANQGCAYAAIMRRNFLDKYRMQCLIPLHLQPRYQWLWMRNRRAFEAAWSLGWEHKDEGRESGLGASRSMI